MAGEEGDPVIRQLAHVCLHTRDLDAMVGFYEGSLGLPVKFSLRNDDGEPVGHYFACGQSTFLEVFDQDRFIEKFGGTRADLAAPAGRVQHLCFEVTGLEELHRRLEAAGVPYFDAGVGLDHSRQTWLADPDGNTVELMEYTAASLQLTGEDGG